MKVDFTNKVKELFSDRSRMLDRAAPRRGSEGEGDEERERKGDES